MQNLGGEQFTNKINPDVAAGTELYNKIVSDKGLKVQYLAEFVLLENMGVNVSDFLTK